MHYREKPKLETRPQRHSAARGPQPIPPLKGAEGKAFGGCPQGSDVSLGTSPKACGFFPLSKGESGESSFPKILPEKQEITNLPNRAPREKTGTQMTQIKWMNTDKPGQENGRLRCV